MKQQQQQRNIETKQNKHWTFISYVYILTKSKQNKVKKERYLITQDNTIISFSIKRNK